jgi:hypothetical protein
MFTGKEISKTEKGTWYCIGQDAPNSFHISVSKSELTIYDHLLNPSSMEEIRGKVIELENDLLSRIPIQSNT